MSRDIFSYFTCFVGVPVLLACSLNASASTLTVPTQYATIQAAINAASNGDTVSIANGTYAGTGNVDIDFGGKSITVASQNGPTKTVIDCNGNSTTNHRGFYFHSGETNATVSGLTIENGYESADGGAILITGGGSVQSGITLVNCNITNNTAEDSGGGIAIGNENYELSVTLTSCNITGNNCSYGSGIANDIAGGGAIKVNECNISDNSSGSQGGYAVVNSNNGTSLNGVITMSSCLISSNTGGGVYDNNGDPGGILLFGCNIVGNTAESFGTGVQNIEGSVGSLSLTSCAITKNSGLDGGVSNYSDGGPITLTNCTISGNNGSIQGSRSGGVVNEEVATGKISVVNCSITANTTAYGFSGGVYDVNTNNGTIALTNDIVYGDSGGEISGSGDTTTYCDVLGGYSGATNINVNPKFLSSPTDLHILSGSPVIGKGTTAGAPTTDKDNNARPSAPSIGAYEFKQLKTALSVANVTGQLGQTVTLTATLQTTAGTALSGLTVSFSVDGTAVGSSATNSSGVATESFTVPTSFTEATHTITCAFAGNSSLLSSSGSGTLTATGISTTVAVGTWFGVSGKGSVIGATVTGSNGNPVPYNEKVSFSVNGTFIGSSTTNNSGVSHVIYNVPVGTPIENLPISVTFAGNGIYNGSSGTGTLTVRFATAITVSNVSGARGSNVTLSANMTDTEDGKPVIPGQLLMFAVDGTSIGNVKTNSLGTSSITYPIPSSDTVGSHTITVTFVGDANYVDSSATGTLTVH